MTGQKRQYNGSGEPGSIINQPGKSRMLIELHHSL